MTAGPRVDEIGAILAHIDAHPKEWGQDAFVRQTDCGTAFCVAGHAMIRAGYTLHHGIDFVDPGGEFVEDPWDEATAVLRLNDDQAWQLFQADNTRGDVQRAFEQIALDAADQLAGLANERAIWIAERDGCGA